MNDSAFLLGAVAYHPKVVTIWEGFKRYFEARSLPFDYILYTNYERQVEALFAGHIHAAWNSPLAWLETERIAEQVGRRAKAICMRDSDRDLTSVLIARREGEVQGLEDLKGRRVAVGAADSPQATLIPLSFLARRGLEAGRDFTAVEFDQLRGKHGDHIGGEREAVRALLRGECDAACLIDGNYLVFVKDGTIPSGTTQSIAQTPAYDHCNFTVLEGGADVEAARFRELLLEISYADPEFRGLLDLEGLKRWLPGRTGGYALLAEAVDRSGYLDPFVESVARQYR
jgi:ABC-type phosphate/phosphonate transport system substrate-binding protein